jgi:hypothetical protein
MKQFIHTPKHLKTHRILPGHALNTRFTDTTPLPGVDRAERQARRRAWTNYRADQRFQYGLGGGVGLMGAALALIVMFFAALGPRPNVLDATAHATPGETVQTVDTAPAADTDAVALNG